MREEHGEESKSREQTFMEVQSPLSHCKVGGYVLIVTVNAAVSRHRSLRTRAYLQPKSNGKPRKPLIFRALVHSHCFLVWVHEAVLEGRSVALETEGQEHEAIPSKPVLRLLPLPAWRNLLSRFLACCGLTLAAHPNLDGNVYLKSITCP